MFDPTRPTLFLRRLAKPAARFAMLSSLWIGLGLSLAACQNDPPTLAPASGAGDVSDPGAPAADTAADAPAVDAEPISVEILNSELALGLERFSFYIKDKDGSLVRDGQVNVQFNRVLPQTGEVKNAASGEALYFGTGMPHGGSWIAYTDFDASGPWQLEVDITRASGARGATTLDVEVDGKTDSPRVGERAPETTVPRLADVEDLALLTSDENPNEALYTLTLDEALTNGKPSVVYLGSPAHCRTDACMASLNSMKSIQGGYAELVNFIHYETRDLENPDETSAAMRAWGLPSEPWFFILDSRGLVQSRIEGAIDVTELDLLVRRSLGEQVTQPQN